MAKVRPLPAKALCKRCNPNQFSFKTTNELEDFDDIIGQKRAVKAIEFGIGIRHKGYNLFVLGPPGTGRHGVIRRPMAASRGRITSSSSRGGAGRGG